MLLMIFFVLLLGITMQRQKLMTVTQNAATKVIPSISIIQTQPVSVKSSQPLSEQAAAKVESDLTNMFYSDQSRQGITVERNSQNIILTFPEQIIFDSGQAQLKPTIQPVLEKVAIFILDHSSLAVEIHGHTDNRPINNRQYPSNWELSADRANQVAKTLVKLGIDPTKLSIKGFGEYHPLVTNDSDVNRLKNRRVEIKFSIVEA
jgi:chemotaxis protein MotB